MTGNIKTCHLCDDIDDGQHADGSDVQTFVLWTVRQEGADSPPPKRNRLVSNVRTFVMT